MVKNYDGASGKAKKLQKYLKKKFSEQNQNQKQAEFIMGEPLKAIEVEDLPKISIITSVYDGDDFIEPFLEDITSQTIFKDKCELVLVNANSPGSEDSVIQKYLKKYPDNIIYEKLEEDPGLYGTWNHALKLSTGEFVTNANLDDRKKLNSIEEHARALVADPQVGLVYADSYITHKPNETFEENSSDGQRYNFDQFSVENMLKGNLPHSNPMWRKSLHKEHGYFNSKFKSAGDWEFFLRCAFEDIKFKKVPEVLGLYYFNPKGISTNPENNSWKVKEELSVYKEYQKKYMEQQSQ